jgi:hypothetical protein
VGRVAQSVQRLRAGRSGDRIPVWARFSAPVQTGLGAHSASCTMGTGSFPGVESARGVTLTPHPLLVPKSKKQRRAIPLLSLSAFVACRKGETYLPIPVIPAKYVQTSHAVHFSASTVTQILCSHCCLAVKWAQAMYTLFYVFLSSKYRPCSMQTLPKFFPYLIGK